MCFTYHTYKDNKLPEKPTVPDNVAISLQIYSFRLLLLLFSASAE